MGGGEWLKRRDSQRGRRESGGRHKRERCVRHQCWTCVREVREEVSPWDKGSGSSWTILMTDKPGVHGGRARL